MNDKKSKKESNLPGWGDWNFVNPYWIPMLILIFSGVQVLLDRFVDYQGIRIAGNIIIKRAIIVASGEVEITGPGIIIGIVDLALIVAIVFFAVCVLPAKGRKYERLRLAGLFVLIGSILKIIISFINLEAVFNIEIGEAFKMPLPTCADLYILGGLIAIIIVFAKNYSEQDIEEVKIFWKTGGKE